MREMPDRAGTEPCPSSSPGRSAKISSLNQDLALLYKRRRVPLVNVVSNPPQGRIDGSILNASEISGMAIGA